MIVFSLVLLITILILLWTVTNSLFLYKLTPASSFSLSPKVSVLIPLRNEEKHVKDLIQSLKSLTYENLEVLMLDDHSEDLTFDHLLQHTKKHARFRIIKGKPLPNGWNGKVHACHQLSQAAKGDYYLFLDADARVAPNTIERTLATLEKRKASMLSGFPRYPNNNFLSHMLVPLQHMVILLHLPLMIANYTKHPLFTAACGIFIMIERDAYETIGGHASVKDSLVEDVHIARQLKRHKYKMILVNITPSVLSYMYETSGDTWEGFKKNIYTGLGRSLAMVIFLSIFYMTVFLLPVVFAVAGMFNGTWFLLLPYLLTVLFKMYVDKRTGHPLWLSFFLPVSILLLLCLMYTSMYVNIKGESYQWKGRFYK